MQLNNSRRLWTCQRRNKTTLKKSNLLLEKGPDCFFKIDEENPNIKFYNFGQLKSKGKPMPYQKYPQNIEYYLYEYKFFDVKTNTIKDGEIFSPYLQFLHTGFHHKEGI